MLLSTLFSLSADLALVDVRLEGEGLTLVLRSNQTNAACPACAQPSTHVHGHYRLMRILCGARIKLCVGRASEGARSEHAHTSVFSAISGV